METSLQRDDIVDRNQWRPQGAAVGRKNRNHRTDQHGLLLDQLETVRCMGINEYNYNDAALHMGETPRLN